MTAGSEKAWSAEQASPDVRPIASKAGALPPFLSGKLIDAATGSAMRGLLIVAIVLGHNRSLLAVAPEFHHLYYWHVHGFFFLAFASRGFVSGGYAVRDMLVRYLVPFAVFLTLGTLINMARAPAQADISAYLTALVIGSSRLCDRASNMSLLWFLPALAGFVTVSILISRLVARASAWPLFVAMILGTGVLLVALIPRDALKYVPLGLPIVAYVLPLSLAFCGLVVLVSGKSAPVRTIMLVAALIACLVTTLLLKNLEVNIALFKFGQAEAVTFVLAALLAVTANVAVYLLSGFLRSFDWLRALGDSSLEIFLLHNFIQIPILTALLSRRQAFGDVALAGASVVVSAIAIGLSMGLAAGLRRLPRLRSLIFPRDWADIRRNNAR